MSAQVRLPKVTPPGGGIISKGEDGKLAVAGRESLKILSAVNTAQPASKQGSNGNSLRIDQSRNLWEGSGLKMDCAITDVAWAYGIFNNKILTSARNGELIMWDLNKSGHSKYERRTKEHLRSIHAMSVSHVVHHYCMTGSADGDFRVWDLRDIQSSVMRVHNPAAVRRVIFSPCVWNPLFVLIGMDNGTLHRWDLKMGHKGLLDRLPVAHTASITTMDWYAGTEDLPHSIAISGAHGPEEYTGNTMGWFASAGLDRCVKIWNLTGREATTRMPNKPTYTLHASYPIRRILWRPGYECEIAVVSHADFTTPPQVDHLHPMSSTPGGKSSRVGSSFGLDSVFKSLSSDPRTSYSDIKLRTVPDFGVPTVDAVEIWDVRRSWIPKWSVAGTSAEGGVTDIDFGGSNVLWTQNSNGTFAQIDLRDVTKPLDAIHRTSIACNPSGAMTFVTDNPPRWEIPYDDFDFNLMDSRRFLKRIGDLSFRPKTQSLGTYISTESQLDTGVFRKLAFTYIIDGEDRSAICNSNMQAALNTGQARAAYFWSLMASLLTKSAPNSILSSPVTPARNKAPAVHSTPASAPVSSLSLPTSNSRKSSDTARQETPARRNPLKNVEQHARSGYRTPSTSRKRTPNSSNSSSPLLLSPSLPAVVSRRHSLMNRRESNDFSTRRSILLRRQSVSGFLHQSLNDKVVMSAKLAGEGVLSDSDSSPGSDDEEDDQVLGIESTDDDAQIARSILLSNISTPSPLSKIANQQQWTEDEKDQEEEDDDNSTPSPQSTDTEQEESNELARKVRLNRRRSSVHGKSRSRSSTIASLPAIPPPKTLVREESQSSIRTITAAEMTLPPSETPVIKDEPRRSQKRNKLNLFEQRKAFSDDDDILPNTKPRNETERRLEIVVAHEAQILDRNWMALREAFEEMIDEGDVQTCATIASVAHRELRTSYSRLARLFDAYLELLGRHHLYTCAAYFRKYSQIDNIKKMTLLDTTIYTSCGRCRKPLIRSAGYFTSNSTKVPAFNYCLGCKAPPAICTICRLPVRAMLFQCSICNHGGHQSCYRKYYLDQPMVDLPLASMALDDRRGRSSIRNLPALYEKTRDTINVDNLQGPPPLNKGLVGHACAAGCGHFCWAAFKRVE